MNAFLDALRTQRWDDHRYYHHCRINQTLHLVSAISFLVAYALMFTDPAAAALVGWLISMSSRQIGHFFFEPTGYDEVNHATQEHKEAIKVGYNLQRKVVLLSIWALSPVALWIDPTLGGLIAPEVGFTGWAHDVGLVWLVIGAAALLFRMVQLFVVRDVLTGIAWVAKILTDPFNDIRQYWASPLYLLRGQRLDPMAPRQGA